MVTDKDNQDYESIDRADLIDLAWAYVGKWDCCGGIRGKEALPGKVINQNIPQYMTVR